MIGPRPKQLAQSVRRTPAVPRATPTRRPHSHSCCRGDGPQAQRESRPGLAEHPSLLRLKSHRHQARLLRSAPPRVARPLAFFIDLARGSLASLDCFPAALRVYDTTDSAVGPGAASLVRPCERTCGAQILWSSNQYHTVISPPLDRAAPGGGGGMRQRELSGVEVSTLGDDGVALFLGKWGSRAVRAPEEHRKEWADRIFFLDDGASDGFWSPPLYALSTYDMRRQTTYRLLPVMSRHGADLFPATWIFPQQGTRVDAR
ncbi:hypothetical protein PR202_ga06524 [Eleusine coracana subsp. coracana]|uniref:Uncharacterized protein n=1 Tax=Eleusine coracana subsp. coracana TaxID=191504 RepID=A0AAV5BWD2_ELECO|nr:hypothetical protein PR202_ga06524 [Eleusine coracana subsp. coracana]